MRTPLEQHQQMKQIERARQLEAKDRRDLGVILPASAAALALAVWALAR